MHVRLALLVASTAGLLACTGSVTACGDEPDVTGGWSLALEPTSLDLGTGATIPGTVIVDATLEQGGTTDILGIGHYVYGTLTASDPRYFQTLSIPRLLKNNGGKTGAVLGCELRINVPITSDVKDDDTEQGPMRLQLVGQIVRTGFVQGLVGSRLVLAQDGDAPARDFAWTAQRR